MARTNKPAMFSTGDVVATSMGEATVVDTRGQAWVKVSGVKRSWWATTELALLNQDKAAAFAAVLAVSGLSDEERAAEKAAEKAMLKEAKAAEKAMIKEAKAAEKAMLKEAKAAEKAMIKEAKAAEKAAAKEAKAAQVEESAAV